MTEPFELTISRAARLIKNRELSPVALMESLLSRSAQLESHLNVWVTMDPDVAMDAARQSERDLNQNGVKSPLHGIPIGIKDIYYTKGMRTTHGSSIYANFVPDYDATTVALLKRAGAIIMGKTVTTEFASGDPPPTKNPWNAEHTPGGSSSGSAAGVAARMFPGSLGSQTAGSVLRPASYNGVVGLKPTFGRIGRYGVLPFAWSLDTMGTFTRSVEDAAIMLNALAGHDPNDHSTSDLPVPDYREAIGSMQTPPRIGVVRQFFFERCDSETRAHTNEVIEKLNKAGAVVEDINLTTNFDTVLATQRTLMAVESAAFHQGVFSERADEYSPFVRAVIESGMITPAVTYVQAQRARRRFRREMEDALRNFDVLLTPSTPSPSPRDLSTTGDPVFQSPWTTCGIPAVSIPSGLSESGLPLGIQLAASPFDEQTLLAAAHWCEEVLDVALVPPTGT